MSGQQMNGYRRMRKEAYGEFPLEVQEFLQICESHRGASPASVASPCCRRTEKEEEERVDKCLQPDQQEVNKNH